jgi:hypothetical protein
MHQGIAAAAHIWFHRRGIAFNNGQDTPPRNDEPAHHEEQDCEPAPAARGSSILASCHHEWPFFGRRWTPTSPSWSDSGATGRPRRQTSSEAISTATVGRPRACYDMAVVVPCARGLAWARRTWFFPRFAFGLGGQGAERGHEAPRATTGHPRVSILALRALAGNWQSCKGSALRYPIAAAGCSAASPWSSLMICCAVVTWAKPKARLRRLARCISSLMLPVPSARKKTR